MPQKKEFEKLKKTKEKREIEKQAIQHQKGKLTARERINLLVDRDSFLELDPFAESRFSRFGMDKKKVLGDAVITGVGKVNGRQVYVYSQDFAEIGGSLGEMHAEKIRRIYELALKTGHPVIGIIDSGGARIQEGVASLDGYAQIFQMMIKASGVIPQITIVAGPSAGGASYSPGLSDFVFMVENISQMYITGPKVIKVVTGEEISLEDLGGAKVHSEISGCCHFVFSQEEDCFLAVRRLLGYLPQNNLEDPPQRKGFLEELFERESVKLEEIASLSEQKSYDIKEVIEEIVDKKSFLEIQENFARNAVIGLGLLSGQVVGIVANQPKVLAGALDINSSDKIARFVRFCDSFNIPLLSLVDVPGYLPGKEQEYQGIIRHGAKVLFAFSEATVPKVALILRKAFGGAYIALSSRKLGFDMVMAWPSAQIGVMGPEGAVDIVYKKELSQAKDKKKARREKIGKYKKFLSSIEAVKMGQVQKIVRPKDTRGALIKVFGVLGNKREAVVARKHGNIPL